MQQTNSCFASLKVISDRDLQTILNPLYELLNYWFQCCDLHWTLVKCQRSAEECTKNLEDTFPCRQTWLRYFFFNFMFPALIDNPNSFKIVKVARLVVSGMFLLLSSASLIFYLHFDLIPSKPSLKWTHFWKGHLLQRTPCFGPVGVRFKQFLLQLHINSSISASK